MVARMFEAVAEAGLYVRVAVPLGTFKLARISPMGYLQATNKRVRYNRIHAHICRRSRTDDEGGAYMAVWKLT